MEVPPTYSPAPRKSKTGLIVGLVLGGIFLCCILPIGLIFGGGFFLFNKGKGIITCTMAFQGVQSGIMKYAADHDGKLPKAETWQDDVREAYRQQMRPKEELGPLEQMSPDGDWGCKEDSGYTGMAFNSDLSGKKLDTIKNQDTTMLLFETEHPSRNLHLKYSEHPDVNLSPKLFGTRRGWVEIAVSGSTPYLNTPGKGRKRINNGLNGGFNVKVDTSSDKPVDKSAPKSDN